MATIPLTVVLRSFRQCLFASVGRQDPPPDDVLTDKLQLQPVQRLLNGNTVFGPPLELIVGIKVLLLHLGVPYLPVVLRRLLHVPSQASSDIEGSHQVTVPPGYLQKPLRIELDAG